MPLLAFFSVTHLVTPSVELRPLNTPLVTLVIRLLRLHSPVSPRRDNAQVDHETLVEKLKEVNEAQLKLVQPKLVVLLGNQSRAALSKLQREAERAQQSRDMLDAQQMPVKKREYAFAKMQKDSFHMPVAAVPNPDGKGGTGHPEALQSALQSSPIKRLKASQAPPPL